MTDRASFDSNILIYASLEAGSEKGQRAADLIAAMSPTGILAAQVILEFMAVVRRKQPSLIDMAINQAQLWSDVFELAATTRSVMTSAIGLVSRHKFQVWDAVIVAASIEAGATVLYSEDMQHGGTLSGLRIVNPFVLDDAAFNALIG